MSDPTDPTDPTQADPVDPTRVDTPAAGGGPPTTALPPTGEPGPESQPPDNRNFKIAMGVLAALVILLVAALFLTSGDDDESDVDVAAPSTIEEDTTSSESTTTTDTSPEPETTATQPTTTTATTEAPSEDTDCDGNDGPPDDPSPVAELFMDAWQDDDRPCAEAIASSSAVDTMFSREPGPTPPTSLGCSEVEEPDPHFDCAFGFEGGTTHLKMNFGATDGWRVFEVEFTAD